MSESRLLGFVSSCCVCVLLAAGPARGVVDGTPAPNSDRRFDAVGLFMRFIPTPGVCGGWVSGSCTLIAPNIVLIARHSLDIASSDPLPTPQERQYRVRFRRAVTGFSENSFQAAGSQCNGTFQEIDVVQLIDAPNTSSDQVLAYLDHAPVGIHPIGLELASPPLTAMNAILAGWGYSGECPGTGDPTTLRIQRGVLPANWSGNDYLQFTLCQMGTIAPCLTCTGTGPFMVANLHDSGGPVLIEVPSTDALDSTPELRLVGSVSTNTTSRRPSAWNNAGGVPQLLTAAPSAHLRRSDFDGNGVINVSDIFAFLQGFFAGSPDCDLNLSGAPDVGDIFIFLSSWFSKA